MLALFVFAILGAVQYASAAIFARAGAPHSLPRLISERSGESIYALIARIAPAPYALDMLARAAYDRRDLNAARDAASRMTGAAQREQWMGTIALASGDRAAARRAFIAAGNPVAAQPEIDRLAVRDPALAMQEERQLLRVLASSGDHPDAVAEATWNVGRLYARQDRPLEALACYRRAWALSPIAAKYLLAAGFQEYDLHRDPQAARDFARAIDIDPSSADAYAGAGMTALRMGDRARARSDARSASALDPRDGALRTLESLLQ